MGYSSDELDLGHGAILVEDDPTSWPNNTRSMIGFFESGSAKLGTETVAEDVAVFGEVERWKIGVSAEVSVVVPNITLKNLVRQAGGSTADITSGATNYYLGGLLSTLGTFEAQLVVPIAKDLDLTALATTKCRFVLTLWRAVVDGAEEIALNPKEPAKIKLTFKGMVRKPDGTAAPDFSAYRLDTPGTGDLTADISSAGHGYSITE